LARELVGEAELGVALARLPAWRRDGDRLVRDFRCADFAAAFACLTRIAAAAEALDHHPDWSQSWNRVEIALTTHSAGGITALDLELARAIDEIVEEAACG
jgi:4a-hydroxytetrahydrobiopterin dehydratase